MRTIAIVNQKGGCGKTTISINLASALAEKGQKTLLVDMDPQSHCAVGLAVPEEQIERSIYDCLISSSRGESLNLNEIVWQISENLELAPSEIDLSAFEQQMSGVAQRENCLQDLLEQVKDNYDFVVIDCPPAVGLLTFNALKAATDVVVPVETGYFSLHGLSKQLDTLSILCQRCDHQVNVQVLASMYDIRTKMAREILSELRKHFAEKMFKTTINFNTKIKEAASYGQPICEYDPTSKGKKDFNSLAEELIGAEADNNRKMVNSLSQRLESISATANELMAQTAPAVAEKIQEIKTEEKTDSDAIVKLEEKLSDYYGVSQIGQAVAFVTLYPRASQVQIAGDWNNWQPNETPLHKVDDTGVWQLKLDLPKGRYRYRLVVDDQWQQDPYNSNTEMNPFGDLNSVLEVH